MRGPSPFLRVQSDERLVAITRRGNQAAYETLVARYNSRLLAFTRHMLGSREDAEDVRAGDVRRRLRRDGRRRAADQRQAVALPDRAQPRAEPHAPPDARSASTTSSTTSPTTARRPPTRSTSARSSVSSIADVRDLPETQRTALLLREIDALSYDQIAEAMETTVPSVKSLLVRARVSLAEAAEARKLTCEEVREELGEVAEGLTRLSPPVRRHLRDCERCTGFRKSLRETNRALALMLPIGPLLLLKKLMLAQLGTTASAGGARCAARRPRPPRAQPPAARCPPGMTAVASKAAATVAAAAIVTAGAVEVDQVRHARPQRAQATFVAAAPPVAAKAHAIKRAVKPTARNARQAGAKGLDRRHAGQDRRGRQGRDRSAPRHRSRRRRHRRRPTRPRSRPPRRHAAPAPTPPVQVAPEEQVDVVTPPAELDDRAHRPDRPTGDADAARAAAGDDRTTGGTGSTPAEPPVTPDSVPAVRRRPGLLGRRLSRRGRRARACGSGASSRTPSSLYVPRTSTSERTGPICRGGKLTTPMTRRSCELLARVVRDLGRRALIPISGPKSTRSFQAGRRASGKSSTSTIRPTRMSTRAKSSNSMSPSALSLTGARCRAAASGRAASSARSSRPGRRSGSTASAPTRARRPRPRASPGSSRKSSARRPYTVRPPRLVWYWIWYPGWLLTRARPSDRRMKFGSAARILSISALANTGSTPLASPVYAGSTTGRTATDSGSGSDAGVCKPQRLPGPRLHPHELVVHQQVESDRLPHHHRCPPVPTQHQRPESDEDDESDRAPERDTPPPRPGPDPRAEQLGKRRAELRS